MKHDSDYPDLDALVLAEIESMGRGRHASSKRARSAREQHRPEPTRQRERPASPKLARIHGEDRAAEGITGEEAEALFDEPLMDESGQFPDEMEKSTHSLFSAEELAFMSRAVGFLSGRDNADMILGQIWEQLTSDHPEEFYAADETLESTPERQNSDQTKATDTEKTDQPKGDSA